MTMPSRDICLIHRRTCRTKSTVKQAVSWRSGKRESQKLPVKKEKNVAETMSEATWRLLLLIGMLLPGGCWAHLTKRSFSDQSVHGYTTERTCWWNEVCKEEFQSLFRCKCPQFSYCRSPGRYYNAYCSMTDTGYIWTQPNWEWGP